MKQYHPSLSSYDFWTEPEIYSEVGKRDLIG
jgi:hypothetical protein